MMPPSAVHRLRDRGAALFRFLLAGLPSFAVAVPLNWLLVARAGLGKPPAYALVLVAQVTVNFFMCRWFVFRNRNDKPLLVQFAQFVSGILAFRVADWCVYSFAVQVLGAHYLLMQLVDVVVFSLLKFAFAERVMEGRRAA